MRTHTLLTISLLLSAAALHSGEIQPGGGAIDATAATAAFSRLKSLVGEWQASTPMGKVHTTYELIAGGSSLVERESAENMPAMLTVYHMDGDRLMLTHYCMTGNQPRMRAASYNAATGEVRFQFQDAGNLADTNAGHMHNAAFRLADADHFTSAWDFYQGGAKTKSETFEYTRVR